MQAGIPVQLTFDGVSWELYAPGNSPTGTINNPGGPLTQGQPVVALNSTVGVSSEPGIYIAYLMSGADIGAQVENCITAATAVGGTCDASQFTGTQSWAANENIVCGSPTAVSPVNVIVPNSGTWTLTLTGGTQALVTAYPGCSMHGLGAQNSFSIVNGSAAGGALYGLWVDWACVGGTQPCTSGGTPTSGYYNIGNFGITQHGSTSFAGGYALEVNSLQDNSILRDLLIFDSSGSDTAIADFYPAVPSSSDAMDLCCSATVYNLTTNGNSGGGIPLQFRQDTNGGYTDWAMSIVGGSFGQQKAGVPNINIVDTSSSHKMTLHFALTDYGEPDHNGDINTGYVVINGAAKVWFDDYQGECWVSGSNKPGFTINGSVNTQLHIGHYYASEYAQPCTLPAVAVQNNVTGQTIMTDSLGNMGPYDSTPIYPSGVTSYRSGLSGEQAQQYLSATPTVVTGETTVDNGSGGAVVEYDAVNSSITSGQQVQYQFCRQTTTTGGCLFQFFGGTSSPVFQFSSLTNTAQLVALLTGQCLAVRHNTTCGGFDFIVGSSNGFEVDDTGDVTQSAASHNNSTSTTNDISGVLTCSSGTVSKTFTTAYTATPVIIVSDETTTGGAKVSTKSATGFTITCTGSSDVVDFMTRGNAN